MRFIVYQGADKEWRWRLVAANNKIIAEGGESYQRLAGCLHGISLVQDGAYDASVAAEEMV